MYQQVEIERWKCSSGWGEEDTSKPKISSHGFPVETIALFNPLWNPNKGGCGYLLCANNLLEVRSDQRDFLIQNSYLKRRKVCLQDLSNRTP